MRSPIKAPLFLYVVLIWCVFLAIIWFVRVHVYDPHDKDYVTAIVGEASNQSQDTMICIAHALRNRGNLKGVYGATAAHVWTENDKTWHKAWVAWQLSGMEPDIVDGAQNFGTLHDIYKLRKVYPDGKGYFDYLVKCGDFYFY